MSMHVAHGPIIPFVGGLNVIVVPVPNFILVGLVKVISVVLLKLIVLSEVKVMLLPGG